MTSLSQFLRPVSEIAIKTIYVQQYLVFTTLFIIGVINSNSILTVLLYCLISILKTHSRQITQKSRDL